MSLVGYSEAQWFSKVPETHPEGLESQNYFDTNAKIACSFSTHGFPQEAFIIVVQSPSRVRLFETTWTAVLQASLRFTVSCSLLKFMSIELVMRSNHLILCTPPPLLFLSSIFPSIRVFFTRESAHHMQWPKYWSFSFRTVLPMNTQGWISQETTWPIISQRLGQDTRICLLLSQILVRFPEQWKQCKTTPEKNYIFKLCFKNLIIFIKEMWLMVTGNEVTIFND